MKRALPVVGLVMLIAGLVWAGTQVDQGAPGNMGPWPVKTVGGNSSCSPDAGTSCPSSVNTKYPTATTTALTGNATPCTAAGGATCTVIYASTDWGQWTDITITISNTDGADAITNVLVEWSPDNSRFEVWDSTTFAALAAGATKSIAISGNSRRYLRIEARAANNVTDAVVTITANDG